MKETILFVNSFFHNYFSTILNLTHDETNTMFYRIKMGDGIYLFDRAGISLKILIWYLWKPIK